MIFSMANVSALNKCFIIAEAGVNHNGELSKALEMIDVASSAGADAIKFQTFSADRLVSLDAKTAAYQKNNAGHDTQYEMLKKLELSERDHRILFEHCQDKGIEFMSTPFDFESLDFLLSLGMKKIKVPSGEITNLPFLEVIASKNLFTILSTGMATLDEISEAVDIFRNQHLNFNSTQPLSEVLTILHCTSNYPCPIEDANLLAIKTIHDAFSLPVGYSDHTLSLDIALVCLGLGAKVYEKHFTLDKTLPGPDHAASLEPADLKVLVDNIRFAEKCLGSPEKSPTPAELDVKKLVRKSIVLNKEKSAGEIIYEQDISFLRPGTGLEPKHYKRIVGATLRRPIPKGHFLSEEDINL